MNLSRSASRLVSLAAATADDALRDKKIKDARKLSFKSNRK